MCQRLALWAAVILQSDDAVPRWHSLAREVGHMAKFVRALQLPADKHRRSLPKQTGINVMAAMGAVQQLISPAAPVSPEQVESVRPILCMRCVCRHLLGVSATSHHDIVPTSGVDSDAVPCTAGQAAAGVRPCKQGCSGEAGRP